MQFGRALLRILQKIFRSYQRLGLVYLSKIDISDGFYRIVIMPEDVPKLAIMFMTEEGDEQWVGFPLVLPMGWKQSPTLFTAATDTVTDLANNKLHLKQPSSLHRLDMVSEITIQPEVAVPDMAAGPKPLPFPARSSPPRPSTASPFRSSPGMFMWMTLSAWCKVTLRTDNMSSASCLDPWTKCYAN
jgi:hypothetical protein